MLWYEPTRQLNYCNLEQVKDHIAQAAGGITRDQLIEFLIPIASRFVDNWQRVPPSFYNNGAAASGLAEAFVLDGNGKQTIYIPYCTAITQVRVRENSTWTVWTQATDFFVWPYNTPYISRLDINLNGSQSNWPQYQRNIEVTARWGRYETTPRPIEEATIILVARLLRGGDQMFQEQSAISVLGQVIYQEPIGRQARALLDSVVGTIAVG